MANRDIIVIGGSTGATQALKRILADLPSDLPASVFVATHMPTHGLRLLAENLAVATPLVVREAKDGEDFVTGSVYVAVPDQQLLIDGATMRLGRGPRENMARPAATPCSVPPRSRTGRA